MSDAAALAEARAQAYDLFAALIGRGLTEDRVAEVEAMPELAGALAAFRGADGALDLDRLAAAHHRLFGFEVFPLVSAFRGRDGPAGGAAEAAVHADLLALTGRGPSDLPADHVAALGFGLARLCGAEADARADGLTARVADLEGRARRLLDAHLLPILPPLQIAVRSVDDGVFAAVLDLAVTLASHHRAGLGPAGPAAPDPAPPTLEAALDDPATGLKDVVGLVLDPSRSGLWLPRGAVVALGRRHGIPSGFGRRADQLEALLFGAIDHDALPAVVEDLAEVVRGAAEAYRAWARRHPPALAAHADAWAERAEATARGLDRMGRAPQ